MPYLLSSEDAILKAKNDNDYVILCGMRGSVEKILRQIGVTKLIPENQVTQTRLQAFQFSEQMLKK